MTSSKIQCSHCTSYRSCSRQTRAFVNYCGSRPQMYTEQIKIAISDCLTKRGVLFQRTIIVPLHPISQAA